MIIPRQKSFSEGIEQREFNSKAAKERNYKWLKKSSKKPVEGMSAVVDRMSNYQDTNSKAWKKLSKKDRGKKIAELVDIQKDNERAKELAEITEIRTKGAQRNYRKHIGNLQKKAEELDNIADKKAKPWETKEYKKSGEIRKKLRNTASSGEQVAMEKANLRGQMAERNFLEGRINKAKKLTEKENKLAKIKEGHKFSNKIKKGIKGILTKIK